MIDLSSYSNGKVIYGITKANRGKFTPLGFTISKTDGVSDTEIQMCRNALSHELGFTPEQTCFQKQVHGNTVLIVPDERDYHHSTEQSDGMITNQANTLLCVSLADCCGVLFWDVDGQIISAVHSGWRGTYNNISIHAMDKIKRAYNIHPSQLKVWLSPCASGEHYLVREDVRQYFPTFCTYVGNEQFLFDNQRAIISQLLAHGIPKHNIKRSTNCTIADTDYHSFRRDSEYSGRMAAFIGLKP